ncbi:MAG TPA: IS110 family transposase [Burkholderiales bacterium]|nr:IS110 family transposase [Burkholderiales bacterium]
MQSIMNLGADVDSRFVVVACAADSFRPCRIGNERKALLTWLRTVPRGSRLAMESTGGHQDLLAELAYKTGLQVFVVNPRDLRRYAEGLGRRGKTDRMDAEVIARYVAREHGELHAYVPPTKSQRELAQLIRRRAKLVETKAAIEQSLRGLTGLHAQAKRLVTDIERLITRLELMMQRCLDKTPAAREAAQRIATIPGFGPLGSTWLAHSFTRVPYTSSDAVVAASGLDPRPDDSGAKRGRRRLSKRGPAEERRILFNCARAAARTQLWRPYYEAQLAKGLSHTAAATILARKMLRVAFALYKNADAFNPCRIASRA